MNEKERLEKLSDDIRVFALNYMNIFTETEYNILKEASIIALKPIRTKEDKQCEQNNI